MLGRIMTGMGIGAGLMYFYDPVEGARRRAVCRQQMMRIEQEMRGASQTVSGDLRHTMGEWKNEIRSVFRGVAGGDRGTTARPSPEFLVGAVGTGLVLLGMLRGAPASSLLGSAVIGVLVQRAVECQHRPTPSGSGSSSLAGPKPAEILAEAGLKEGAVGV